LPILKSEGLKIALNNYRRMPSKMV